MKPSDLRRGTILGSNGMPIRPPEQTDPERPPRVSICVPSTGTWKAHTGVSVTSIVSVSVVNGIGIMLNAENNSVITQARNKLVRLSKEQGADFIFWFDADMVAPSNTLLRLLAHHKEMACAFYNQRLPPHRTVGHIIGQQFDVRQGGLHEADHAGMGCMLTHMSVFEKFDPPWFKETYEKKEQKPTNPDGMVGEDTNFIRSARKAGFKLWVDLDLTFEIGHVGENVITCLKPPPDQPLQESQSQETIPA
jgi:hypothetical protein